jgi:hypothetical protein
LFFLLLSFQGNTTRPDTVREFFQAHRHEVEFIGNVGTSQDTHDPATKIVSVDVTGRIFIWPYKQSSYSGFGWFIPSAKYKLRSKYEGGEHPIKISLGKFFFSCFFFVYYFFFQY